MARVRGYRHAKRPGNSIKNNSVDLTWSTLTDEQTLTEKLQRLARIPAGSALILGIGDDCAVYRPRGSADDLLFTTDMLIEDVHFRRVTHTAAAVGRKALARGLSDIAAMGGSPRFCLVSLCVPAWADTKWVDAFFRGLTTFANDSAAPLAGGDLSHGPSFACDIVVCGGVPRGQALLRRGARPGHHIYVSGRLGGSAVALKRNRVVTHKPRLPLGILLRSSLKATAAIDLSDGLSLDLHRLCLASNAAAELDRDPPRAPGATASQALHGGEDYELLFTVRPRTKVPPSFEGAPLTRIGSIVKGRPGDVRYLGVPLPALGYDHFSDHSTTS